MAKDISYHQAAVEYNKVMQEAARGLVESIQHPLIKKWCLSIARQHEFHGKKHQRSVDRLSKQSSLETGVGTEEVPEDDSLQGNIQDLQKEYAEMMESQA